jgi:hypothetical protein
LLFHVAVASSKECGHESGGSVPVAGGFGDEASSKFFELDACEPRRRAQHDFHDVHFPSANEQVVRDLVDVLLRAMLPNPSTTEIKWAVRTRREREREAGNA